MVSLMFLSVIFLISRTCDNNGCIYQRLWYRWIAIKVCSCAPAFTFVPTPLAGATTNGLLISQILRKSAQLFEFYCSQYIVSLPATIRQITSYGQFRQATSENTFIQGQEIAAHCECWLLCAIQILLLTYLLTNRQTNKQTAVKTASPPKVVKAIDNMCTVCWQYHCGFSVKFARGFVYPWSKWRRRCNKFNYAGFLSGRLLAGVGLGLHVAGIRRRGLSTRLSISHQIFNALSA